MGYKAWKKGNRKATLVDHSSEVGNKQKGVEPYPRQGAQIIHI